MGAHTGYDRQGSELCVQTQGKEMSTIDQLILIAIIGGIIYFIWYNT